MKNPLKAGQVLKNPANWKRAQNAINAFGGCLPLVAIFIPNAQFLIDADFAAKLYGAIGAINVYLTIATTEKIGF